MAAFLCQTDFPRPLFPVGDEVFKVGYGSFSEQEVFEESPPVVEKDDDENGNCDEGDDDEGNADNLPRPGSVEQLVASSRRLRWSV